MFSIHISYLRDIIQSTLNKNTGNTKLEGIEITLDQKKLFYSGKVKHYSGMKHFIK